LHLTTVPRQETCFTYESRLALVRFHEDVAGACVVIGTFLILWLGVAAAIWLAWAASFVARLFVGLASRIRINPARLMAAVRHP
jgi:hypothetical protein